MTVTGFESHDHARCIAETMQKADTHCAATGLRFTPVRRRVLELLVQEHRAMGAYDILEHLTAEGLGSQPPVAYRALDFLVSAGLAHRIERLNAYTACTHPGPAHRPAFLICRLCQHVAEADSTAVSAPLDKTARESGFVIEEVALELEGLCPTCAETGA